ncbi:MAG: hypothetical protein HYW86_04745 [Candidatus Roizmanbacteria bacterium]|nr:MAG: hypothetical protein HYW86_04745 [Candidatus Roizmanbacteria bacterium]
MKIIENLKQAVYKSSNKIEKRIRFVLSSGLITLVMMLSTFFFFDKALYFIPLFIVVTYLLTYFSILQGIEKTEWLMLFIMPILLTLSFYLFYFLFPVRWITRLPFMAIFVFSLYALLLCSNIFNVGVEKSLQLYRAAFSVNYFYQTLVIFLMSNVILSFRLNPFVNGLLIFIIVFFLALQLLWSVKPKINLERTTINYAFFISIIMFQIAILLSFIPIKLSIFALFITAVYYSLCGLIYHYLEQKLFSQTIREYLIVIGFVFAIALLSLQW